MNGNKIFSCHHPCFGLVQQPHSVLRKLCVKEWLPRLLSRVLTPPHPPVHPTHPLSFSPSAYTVHVCLNADGIKRLLLPHSISVFLFYLLLQVEGICGMHAVLDLIILPLNPSFCTISIHFVCCFSPTHMSQANPKLASTTCLSVLCLRLEQRPPARRCLQPLPRLRARVCTLSVLARFVCPVCCPCSSRDRGVCMFN